MSDDELSGRGFADSYKGALTDEELRLAGALADRLTPYVHKWRFIADQLAEALRELDALNDWVFAYLTSECDWDLLPEGPELEWVRDVLAQEERTAAALSLYDSEKAK